MEEKEVKKDEIKTPTTPVETPRDLAVLHEKVEETAEVKPGSEFEAAVKNMAAPVGRGLIGALKPPVCPLCDKPMFAMHDPVKKVFAWACNTDRIAINVLDPLVGKWKLKPTEKIPCLNPNCAGVTMKMFFTSVGYMKAKCPKCKATVSGSNVDRKGTEGTALKKDGWGNS